MKNDETVMAGTVEGSFRLQSGKKSETTKRVAA
jgi:hypothetical protein